MKSCSLSLFPLPSLQIMGNEYIVNNDADTTSLHVHVEYNYTIY